MTKLIYVYNAHSSIANKWMDMAHKIISPETYACDLCSLTHGSFREKRIWKDFREQSKIEMEFLYRNEFLKRYKSKWLPKYDLPIVLYQSNGNLSPILTASDFKEIKEVQILIDKLQKFIDSDFD